MIKVSKHISIILIACSLHNAQVAKGQVVTDSLSSYIEIAAKNNPTVVQKYFEYLASLQKVPQVGVLPDPELNIGFFPKPMDEFSGTKLADFNVMQMFPWKGTLKSAKDEMTLMAKANYESYRDAKFTVSYDVQSSWFELYKIDRELRITTKNIGILQMIERLALVKYRSSGTASSSGSVSVSSGQSSSTSGSSGSSSGMNTMGGGTTSTISTSTSSMSSGTMPSGSSGSVLVDLFKIKIALGDLQNDSAVIQSQKKTEAAKFNTYLNRDEKTAVFLPDSIPLSVLNMTLETIFDSIIARSPMLGMLKFEQRSLESRKQMQKKMGYPMIGIGVNYSLIRYTEMSPMPAPMNGKDMIMPMVKVTLPIYRKKFKAQNSEVDLLNKAKEQEYNAQVNNLQTEYYEAVQLYQDAERRIKLYTSQYQLASQSLDIQLSSFTSSGSDLKDILLTQQELLDYEYKIEEASADYNTAIAWFNQLIACTQTE